jgi:hypothetical protein
MGVSQLQGGFQDGELPLNMTDSAQGVHPYFGGQPATIDASGVRLCLSGDEKKFIGVFKNSSYQDRQNGNATILGGICRLKFINGSISADNTDPNGNVIEGAPYDTTVTFAPGDKIFISATGLWTNTGTAGQEKGIVIKGQSTSDDSVEVYMMPVVAVA